MGGLAIFAFKKNMLPETIRPYSCRGIYAIVEIPLDLSGVYRVCLADFTVIGEALGSCGSKHVLLATFTE